VHFYCVEGKSRRAVTGNLNVVIPSSGLSACIVVTNYCGLVTKGIVILTEGKLLSVKKQKSHIICVLKRGMKELTSL